MSFSIANPTNQKEGCPKSENFLNIPFSHVQYFVPFRAKWANINLIKHLHGKDGLDMFWSLDSSFLAILIISLNIAFAITIIFLERKQPSSTWAWLLVLVFLPLIGFILYLLLGRQLRKKHLFRWEGRKDIGIDKLISYQEDALKHNQLDFKHS